MTPLIPETPSPSTQTDEEAAKTIRKMFGDAIDHHQPMPEWEDVLKVLTKAKAVREEKEQTQELGNEALIAPKAETPTGQKKTHSAAAAIHEFEQSLVDALKLVRLAHSSVSRTFEGDGGGAHPSLGLMEISQRALHQADDAARYARHALSAVVPRP